jgi:hypothetical protein
VGAACSSLFSSDDIFTKKYKEKSLDNLVKLRRVIQMKPFNTLHF